MNTRTLIPLITALLTLLIAGGLYGGGYYLLNRQEAKAEELGTEIGKKNLELAKAARAHAALASLSADEETLDQYSIRKADVVPFLESIQGVGRPLGSKVDVLSVGDVQDGKHARIALSISITGSFDAVVRTLGAIEYGPYDGVITNLSLDTATNDPKGTPQWTAAAVYSVGIRSASSTKP